MTARHTVLAALAVLVLGFAVYLLIAVGSAPPKVAERAAAVPERVERVEPSEPVHAVGSPGGPGKFVPRPAIALQPGAFASAGSAQRPEPLPAVATPDAELSATKLDAVMDEANKAYDRGDYDDAKIIAGRVLGRFPTNVRMLRIMVSSSCMDGDGATAQVYFSKLPQVDQEQMKVRCARYGVAFADKP